MDSIPLLKLPDASVDIIVRLLDFREIIVLCLCSNRSAQFVKRRKPKVKTVLLEYSNNHCAVTINEKEHGFGNNYTVVFFKTFTGRVQINMIFHGSDELYEHQSKVIDPIRENIIHGKRLMGALDVENCNYRVYMNGFESVNLKKYLKRVLIENYTHVQIVGRFEKLHAMKLSLDEIDFIMNNVKPEASISFDVDFPLDFNHEKCFKFKSIYMSDSRWVKTNHLKSLRNKKEVSLRKTNFTSQDLNEFLHNWTDCEEDMMIKIKLRLDRKFPFDGRAALHKLTFASCESSNVPNWYGGSRGSLRFIKAYTSAKRKYPVGVLHIIPNSHNIEFTTFKSTNLSVTVLKYLDNIENVEKLGKVKVEVEQLLSKYQKMLENVNGDIPKARVMKELEIIVGSRSLIEERLNSMRYEWRQFLLGFYSGLLPLAVSTGIKIDAIIITNK